MAGRIGEGIPGMKETLGHVSVMKSLTGEASSFSRGNKGYLNIWKVSRGFWGECTSLPRARVLGMSHLDNEFQVLQDMTFQGERKFSLATG